MAKSKKVAKPTGVVNEEQLGLGDAPQTAEQPWQQQYDGEPQVEPEEKSDTPELPQEEQQAAPAPQMTNVQLLDASFQNFLLTHYIPMFELVGLFELKLIEFKEAWRLEVSGKIQKNMDDAREAQQNGNAH